MIHDDGIAMQIAALYLATFASVALTMTNPKSPVYLQVGSLHLAARAKSFTPFRGIDHGERTI